MKEITIVINISETPSEAVQVPTGQTGILSPFRKVLYSDLYAVVGITEEDSVSAAFRADSEDCTFKITFTALSSYQHFCLSRENVTEEQDLFANDAGILEFRLPVSAHERVTLESV